MSEVRIMRSIDLSDSPLASFWPDVAAGMDNIERKEFEEFAEHHGDLFEEYGRQIAMEVIRRVFTDIAQRDHAQISIMAFFISMGFTSITVESLEEIGQRLGVTKQAVSKELTFFRDMNGVRPLGSAKSEQARGEYKRVQLERYEQQQHKAPEQTNGIGFADFYAAAAATSKGN